MPTYIAIDLKSFYASVECVDRNLDALTTNLVVADESRTEKTICLAVSPSLKQYGIGGRARLFEVIQKVKEINSKRSRNLYGFGFKGSSYNDIELKKDPSLKLDYIIAPPRMSHYMEVSTNIFNIYLKYVATEDIHVYSIDEVFMDVTHYLNTYKMSAEELARTMIQDVLKTTGITATAGIGTNLYLAKVAMDIVAKHMPADGNGVRVASLDEMEYRRLLWDHRPLTDFWRVGRGISKKLEENGLYTMGDIARCSLGKITDHFNEDLLYGLFGINAELLIDHAWGWEPCTMQEIKAYKPQSNSLGTGQVLSEPYTYEKARLIVKEMGELLSLDLVRKKLVTDHLVLMIGYDAKSLENGFYKGEVKKDWYGKQIPKHGHGTIHLKRKTASTKMILEALLKLYEDISNPNLLVRRINITACNTLDEKVLENIFEFEQLDLFSDYEEIERKHEEENKQLEKEKKAQLAINKIKEKYGKNAILKGMNLEEGATTKLRNGQVGGHKS